MFRPGELWLDTDKNPIQAHGGCVLFHEGTYYWFGENKDADTIRNDVIEFQIADPVGISCYSSQDLTHWKNEGIVLSASQIQAVETETLHVIERPKVVFNRKFKCFVLWFHADSRDYQLARVGVAVSASPAGPYDYRGSFRPVDNDSRDMTLFQDDDGSAYIIFASEWNQTLRIARLSDDYLSTTGENSRCLIHLHREAPAILKRSGLYYLITSGCTGWESNEALVATAPTIFGPWQVCGNPCIGPDADKTFLAQSTFVLPLPDKPDAFIFMADRWNRQDLRKSCYVWLPIHFENDTPGDPMAG